MPQTRAAPPHLVKGHVLAAVCATATAARQAPTRRRAGAATAGRRAVDRRRRLPDCRSRTTRRPPTSGKVYSAFGYNGTDDTSDLYAYDPDSGAWTKLASAADTREAPAHGIIGGKLYAAGGWGSDGNPDAKPEIYDPAADTWTTGAANPKPYAGSGSAVLDGKLYVVGGCTADACGTTDVQVYDPAADTWSAAAAYPEPVAWESCGAIGGKLYCAGGTTDAAAITHAYVYDPASDAWSPIADLPTDLWGAGYTAAERACCWSRAAYHQQQRRADQPGLRPTTRRPTPGPRCPTPTPRSTAAAAPAASTRSAAARAARSCHRSPVRGAARLRRLRDVPPTSPGCRRAPTR